jgi:medium-chain acyl-[acyl-carrier-protein] hydrolase
MFTGNGELALCAQSTWVFLDLDKQKFAMPPEELVKGYGALFPEPMEKIKAFPSLAREPDAYELKGVREFGIYRRDIDANAHVNNVRYLEWALDDIPDGIYDTCRATQVQAAYKKQCRAGDRITAQFLQLKDNPNVCASAYKRGDVLIAEIYSLWSDKDG